MENVVVIDTRENKNYIETRFTEIGIKYVRSKLYVGDFTLLHNQTLCIDRKDSIQELCGNVCQQHERFRDELQRARDAGIKLIVLVADEKIKDLFGLVTWYNYRKKFSPKAISGKQLYGICKTLQERYGVGFRFCKKSEMAEFILELLNANSE